MKINMREVMEAKNKITSSRNKLQAEINRAKSDWKTVQGSDALSGKVKTAINGEINSYYTKSVEIIFRRMTKNEI